MVPGILLEPAWDFVNPDLLNTDLQGTSSIALVRIMMLLLSPAVVLDCNDCSSLFQSSSDHVQWVQDLVHW